MKPYYEDGSVTIYHEDCREILPQLDSAHAVITDPPYGIARLDTQTIRQSRRTATNAYRDIVDDDYAALLTDVQAQVARLGDVVMVTPGISNVWRWPPATWVLCWHKPGSSRRMMLSQPNRPQGGFNEWEPVLVYGKRARFMHDTLSLPANPQPDTGDHPCPKPLRLLRWLIQGASDPGDLILDPFAGSGTTLRAAKDLGRRAIGIEVEERYCEIAAKRCAQDVLNMEAA